MIRPMPKALSALLTGVFMMTLFSLPVSAAPVAKIGSWTLQMGDVDKALESKIHKIKTNLYRLRMEYVREQVRDHLMEKEAKAQGISSKELWKKEIEAKANAPTDEQVKAFIDQNKANLPNEGKGMEGRISDFMRSQKTQILEGQYLIILAKKYDAEILLEKPTPPRMNVTGPTDLSKGDASAPITIIEFSDFECRFCKKATQVVDVVMKHYGPKTRLVYRHFPMSFHKQAPKASEASLCAADQKKFWEYHDALFDNPKKLHRKGLTELAKEVGLNVETFDTCLDSGNKAARVKQDLADGKKLGITGTPTFFINGLQLVGAVPPQEFRRIIDAELERLEGSTK
ncbi:MAG: thioredoxin domain-containing protein [Magnetococcales bacterium]|nr:thioredoxin domain-containing protein [Magnetococcales bacterium]